MPAMAAAGLRAAFAAGVPLSIFACGTGAVCLRHSTFIHSTVHFWRLSQQATRGKSSWRLTVSVDRFPMTAEVLRRVESVGDGEFRQTGQEPLMIHTHTTSECVITCPHCRTAKVEVMPADACIFFYECSGCGALLKRKPGSCCVFCSYGSVPCPPVQQARACEKDMRSSLYA